MQKASRTTAILFVLAFIASACGGSSDVANAASDVVAEATTTTAAETTTTTEAPAADEADEAEVAEETTTTTEEPPQTGPVYPLTGEFIDEGAVDDADHAAVVVKISNNDEAARSALDGLDEADLIYEERIENEATRFAAVYHSELPEQVGSIRSGRTSDIQIVANLNRPVFGFSGANDGVHDQLREAEVDGILLRVSADFGDPQLSRISDFPSPNNLVADVSRLIDVAPEDSDPPEPVFDYSNNVSDLGRRSPGVSVDASSVAQYVWSEDDGGYLRFHDGVPLITQDGVHIAPVNVIVLTTTYIPSEIDALSVDAVTIGEGRVEVYSNGDRVDGTWTREFARDAFTLTTADGDTIGLAPGQTWISLAPSQTSTELTDSQAEELAENAG